MIEFDYIFIADIEAVTLTYVDVISIQFFWFSLILQKKNWAEPDKLYGFSHFFS